ncbi:PEP/pyruvate-binding domain-containing protein [Nitrosospira sp. Nsp13]|uniref:PEP/pyruvate-binding domain-containing protein n=1 Tax=Nitrosospira sp. Nsp13 TaxID=1855332 RepID=UPI00087E5757|nr:PEP/pyruvate-binding domain-containing protein [Nitrosospira sp. Nsp13]SCX88061.1 pyruvate, water dikinase [Nitrosospira sp. Nsp13]
MAAQPTILDWQGVLAADAVMVGGKAWQLARLKQFGLPVPEGLVIPAGWCPLHTGAALPPELTGALQEALAARDWLNKPLVVRSSAAGEDSAKASFAGIYRSRLNVCGMEQIQAAIHEVWSSLWSPAAIAYQRKLELGADDTAPGMAVIIMPLLPAVASGIAFTCDPISGRDDRLVIHAQWGLGESLVGGQTDGDEYVFAEDPFDDHWTLLHRRMGGKATKAVTQPGSGTAMIPTPAAEAGAFVLSSNQALQLVELLRDAAVALDFIHPFYDLEWVWDGDRFWLTQGRPVTARPHYTYAPLQTQPVYWTRGNTCEVVPEPLSAIDWSNSRKLVNGLLTRGYLLAGYPVLPGAQRAGFFHGRLYLALSLLQWECFDALGVAPKAVNGLIGGHQPEIVVPPTSLGDRLARLRRVLRYVLRSPAQRRRGMRAVERAMIEAGQWRKQTPPGDAAGLQAEILRQFRAGRGAVDLFFLQGSSGGSLSMLVEQLDSYFPGEGYALGTALLAGGEPSVTARQGYELMALARLSREIASRESHEASGSRQRCQYGKNPEFQHAFDRFLEHYGHRGLYETYFRNPRWREAPEYLLSSLAQLAEVDEVALRVRQQAAVAEALTRIKTGVPFWKRAFIEGLANATRQECNQREAARSALVAYMEPERQLLLAAGRYLARQGALMREADIFQLMLSEILRALGGDIPAAGVRARVAERNRLFEQWSQEIAPDVLVEASKHSTPGWQAQDAVAPENDSPRYQGIPTGTGRARGKACLLRHPSEGYRLQPGDILVAPSTDPGWTPLFLSAGGLVVETGGYLSHGAIVAREFGIPAVVNLPGILGGLKDGDMVEVDGTSGVVTLLEQ